MSIIADSFSGSRGRVSDSDFRGHEFKCHHDQSFLIFFSQNPLKLFGVTYWLMLVSSAPGLTFRSTSCKWLFLVEDVFQQKLKKKLFSFSVAAEEALTVTVANRPAYLLKSYELRPCNCSACAFSLANMARLDVNEWC